MRAILEEDRHAKVVLGVLLLIFKLAACLRAGGLLVYSILADKTALPPPAASPADDEKLLGEEPWIESPVKVDYGYNVK